MDRTLARALESLKKKYQKSGFIVIGVFGSYARGEEKATSDIDILYCLTKEFHAQHPGWKTATALSSIQEDFEKTLNKKVDIVDKDALRNAGKKYILPEVEHV